MSPGQPIPPPANSAVSVEVFQALSRGMSTEPSARFPSLAELIVALLSSQVGEGAAARAVRCLITAFGLVWVLGSAVYLSGKRTHSTLRLEDLIGVSALRFLRTAR